MTGFCEFFSIKHGRTRKISAKNSDSRVRVPLSRDNKPNALSSILRMIGDYGFNMDRIELINQDFEQATFELLIKRHFKKIQKRFSR